MIDLIENAYGERVTLRTAQALRSRACELDRAFQPRVGMRVDEPVTRVRFQHAADLIHSKAKIEATRHDDGRRTFTTLRPRR
jgi:methylphosphotriester-DNA--protein-cysteine methyltransferase